MKRFLLMIFAISLTLTACGTAQTQAPPVAQTSTLTLSATTTQTPIPPTSTITALPTIPTFTPTFDVSTIVTVTPAEKAECPKLDTDLFPSFKVPSGNDVFFSGTDIEILNFINQGGSLQTVVDWLSGNGNPTILDITNDGVPELVFVDFGVIPNLHIFTCQNQTYKPLSSQELVEINSSPISLSFNVHDMNLNNIPELTIMKQYGSGSGFYSIDILEWTGKTFRNLASNIGINGLENIEIEDFNHDGLIQLKLTGGLFGQCCIPGEFPLRKQVVDYEWNGQTVNVSEFHYANPVFRFQAIEDADVESLAGYYERALGLYQDSIFDKNLEWWSSERAEFTIQHFYSDPPEYPNFSSPPQIKLNEAARSIEYTSLAAYAYYRIILLHIVQDQETEAASAYQTLQETFGSDPYAAPYVEMATAFWESYQSMHKMYNGCAAAIQYAVEHPDILIPLGSDYHGWQSHIYKPEDICPFR